ncbi:MAG: hypothetical protein M1828_005546 [Chrysothrix sp. TS-e1954]|nr:MAG: hypothetical protein M1828_005546 [Chrysothrix sp. TS-e1954]
MPHKTTHSIDIPPFPTGLKEAPVQRISLTSILSADAAALADLKTACRTHGFFYLDLADCPYGNALQRTSSQLHSLMHAAFALPQSSKQQNAIGGPGARGLFGFKKAGIVATDDVHQRRDRGEMWNVSKDDVLGQSDRPVEYPTVIGEQAVLFEEFDRTAHEVGMCVLDVLADSLGVSREELRGRHRITEQSGDHSRLTWGPGDSEAEGKASTVDDASTRITTYAHTDFGSVTLLFNWLGGLQIESHEPNPKTGQKEWQWVRPLDGHAICNLGDSMVQFSGGQLRSGKHRVVAAPGEQAKLDRYSLVYFVRPEDDVVLEDLTVSPNERDQGGKKYKAKEWIEMRGRDLGNAVKSD